MMSPLVGARQDSSNLLAFQRQHLNQLRAFLVLRNWSAARVSSLTYGCPARMHLSCKVSWLLRISAFLSFLSPLTTTTNPVGEQCKPALSHFWESLFQASSYSNGFVQPWVRRKAAWRNDHGLIEVNASMALSE